MNPKFVSSAIVLTLLCVLVNLSGRASAHELDSESREVTASAYEEESQSRAHKVHEDDEDDDGDDGEERGEDVSDEGESRADSEVLSLDVPVVDYDDETDANQSKFDWFAMDRTCGKFEGRRNKGKRAIMGGYTAEEGQYPPYALLSTEDGSGSLSLCGGTLITNQHVLTAAHCNAEANKTVVRFTQHNYYSEKGKLAKAISVSKVCTSSGWLNGGDKNIIDDISIIRLQRPIKLSRRVFPACLPVLPLILNPQVYAIGLGYKENHGDSQLEADDLQVLPVKEFECPAADKHESKICFKSNDPNFKGDSCEGDSGGPLLTNFRDQMTIYAITSYGPQDCHPGVDGYSVNVNVYQKKTEIKDLIDNC